MPVSQLTGSCTPGARAGTDVWDTGTVRINPDQNWFVVCLIFKSYIRKVKLNL